MTFLSVKYRIVLGLVTILLSTLLLVIFSGFGPDARQSAMQGRKKLCESIAVNCSVLVSQDDLARMERILTAIADRDEDLLSAGVRRADGRMIIEVGEHEAEWVTDMERSTETQVQVPLWAGESRWGNVELRFHPLSATGFAGIIESSWTLFLSLTAAFTFVIYSFYLGKVLRQLDPSKAIPKRVRSALDALAEGLLVTDKKGRVLLANEAFAQWAGQNADSLIGRKVSSFPWNTPENMTEPGTYPWVRALAERAPQAQFLLGLTDDKNKQLALVANSSPILGHDGEYRGVLTSFEDVTELEKHKAELSDAKQAADEANRAKSEFLARMSHEIRTPMNAILGYTEVLRRGFAESEEQRGDYLSTIHNSGEHLLALINDILDLSKVESGRLELEMARHSPHAILAEAISVLHVKAEEKGLALSCEAEGKLPETILTDAVRLRQAIINLVGNAIKFTETGSVSVVARLLRGPQPRMAIDVIDTGVGISEEALERIFEPFSQADTTITRRYGGTGLGLSITRQLAEQMGGDISVKSQLGHGTTFTMTLDPGSLDRVPLIDLEAAKLSGSDQIFHEESQVSLTGSRILVVDDGEENRQLVSLFLSRVGLEVVSAENGRVAIEMASEQQFDAILMDMQMPVMDGIMATKRLRELGFTTPIIALTANVMKDDETKCREAGCSGFLTKPINMDRLMRALSSVLGTPHADEQTKPTNRASSSESSQEKQSPSKQLQGNSGHCQLTRASSAGSHNTEDQQAPLFSSLPTEDPEFYEIVVGFVDRLQERVREMRQAATRGDYAALAGLAHWLKGAGGSVGFHLFTAPAAALQKNAEVGDDEGIAKNLGLIENIGSRIQVDQSADSLAVPDPVNPSTSPATPEASERNHYASAEKVAVQRVNQAVVDLAGEVLTAGPVTSSLPMEDPEFREIVEEFVDRLQTRIADMRRASEKAELAELADLAHWLKGAGGSMGFDLLATSAAALQSSAKSGDINGVAVSLQTIEEITSRIEI